MIKRYIYSVPKNRTKYLVFVCSKISKTILINTVIMVCYAFFRNIISYGNIASGGVYSIFLNLLHNKLMRVINKNHFIAIKKTLYLEQNFCF